MPLPTITASAVRAKPSAAWAWTATPFIERTWSEGHTISALSSGCLTRLIIAEAMNESSSLNPSSVMIAIRFAVMSVLPSLLHLQPDDGARRLAPRDFPEARAVVQGLGAEPHRHVAGAAFLVDRIRLDEPRAALAGIGDRAAKQRMR